MLNEQVFVPESQVSPSVHVEGRASSSVRHGFPCQSLTHQTPDTIPQQVRQDAHNTSIIIVYFRISFYRA